MHLLEEVAQLVLVHVYLLVLGYDELEEELEEELQQLWADDLVAANRSAEKVAQLAPCTQLRNAETVAQLAPCIQLRSAENDPVSSLHSADSSSD